MDRPCLHACSAVKRFVDYITFLRLRSLLEFWALMLVTLSKNFTPVIRRHPLHPTPGDICSSAPPHRHSCRWFPEETWAQISVLVTTVSACPTRTQ